MNVRKFRFLRRKSLLGKVLRLPFKIIPNKSVLPILWGPLHGKKWIKGSHNLSILLGTYERNQTRFFQENAVGINVFWDLGAHVGYYSLLFRTSNASGKIVAFEPLPSNGELFNEHMKMNSVSDYNLYQFAVSDKQGGLSFNKGKNSVAGKLSMGGDIKVKVVQLSDWLSRGLIEVPQLIKMDIEGEETKVLRDLKLMLTEFKPKIFLSTHGDEVHRNCVQQLLELGYSLTPLDANDLKKCRELLAV